MQVGDLGAHVMVFAVDLDPVGPGDHGRAARAAGLETCKQHGVAGIRRIEFQMVKDTASGRHAAGRDDDLGHRVMVERLGLLAVVDIGGDAAGRPALVLAELVARRMLAEEFARINRHRAVEIDGDVGDARGRLQLVDVIEERLGPPDGKGRDEDSSAALGGAVDDVGEGILRVALAMPPVAIGGFQQEEVGLRDAHRGIHDRITGAAKVA